MSEEPKRKKIMIRKKGAAPKVSDTVADEPVPPVDTPEPAAKEITPESVSPIPMPIPGEETIVMETPSHSHVVFKFYCVYCGQKLSAKGDMAGKRIRCPTCRNQIEIPVPPGA